MPNGLTNGIVFRDFIWEYILPWFGPCRPRVLIVTDGGLDFSTSGFGLSRFIEAIRGNSPQPIITLAHRTLPNHTVIIGGTSYSVLGAFDFAAAPTAATVANYDQVWMFGILEGAAGLSNPDPLSATEVNRIGQFMNAGGGVFSTGDHAMLGQGMGGELPRIRHMREWASIPMGGEGNPTARDRIDTVVDPGPGGLYEFNDQSDDIPQRVYPNYRVTWAGSAWTATIHPLLRMPGTPASRTTSAGFTNDMDVMPDHPHESVCFEVSAATNAAALNGTYNLANLNFAEFPNAFAGGGRIGSEIVAYAVSGGRSVLNGVWKPPVNPRMFGIMSAFDGHAAQAYTGAPTRPGRIVCDSTWHHFVNINLDGTGSGRSGLGAIVAGVWTPSAACQKIFRYYDNILRWLQPLNRQLCPLWYDLVVLRLHPYLIEELMEVRRFKDPRDFEGLGLEVIRLLDLERGQGAAIEAVRSALRLNEATAALADSTEGDLLRGEDSQASPIVAYTLGKALAQVAEAIPVEQPDRLRKLVRGKGTERYEKALGDTIVNAAGEAVALQVERAEARLKRFSALAGRGTKTPGCS